MHLLSAIVFLAWLLILGRTVANLLFVHRLRASDASVAEPHPFVSVIIPARNEARAIERTLRAFLAQDYDAFEVIVVDDRSTDGTGDIARAIGDPRLVVIRGEEPPPGWLGKPWALHEGSEDARGELLLFVDADVHYEKGAIRAAVAHLQRDRDVAFLCLLPRFVMHGFWEHIAMPQLPMTGFAFLPTWFSNRSRISALALGAGTGNLVRRDVYERAGGHVALKDAVIDDIGLARLVRRSGERTEVVRADDLVSVRMYHGLGEIVRGFTKNVFAATNRRYSVALLLMLLMGVLNVLPYVMAALGDLFAIATLLLIFIVRLVVFISLRFRVDNAILGHLPATLLWFVIFIRSMWKTGVRRELEWRGRTYDASETRFGPHR